MKVKDFLLIGLGVLVVILKLENSKLNGEVEILKENLSDVNRRCDNKDRYIGKILTELKKS